MKTRLVFEYLFSFLFIFSFSLIAFAATPFPGYQPLTSIPGINSNSSLLVGDNGPGLSAYLDSLYKMGVAAAAGLAVIMVIWGGIQYITSAGGEGKSSGRERISSAILGLLLALGSYLILQTINPALLKLSFSLDDGPGISTSYNGTPQQQANLQSQLNDIQNHIDTLDAYNSLYQDAAWAQTLHTENMSYAASGDHSVQKINFVYNGNSTNPGTTAIAPAGTYKIGDKIFIQSLKGKETSSLQFSDGIVTITGIDTDPNASLRVNMGNIVPSSSQQNQPSNIILKEKTQ